MRVGLVCPYSLSRPGGVQGQVLGLARQILAIGHESVILAPADGPVDVVGLNTGDVVVLGRSLPVPANGSMAPVSVDPRAVVRAARAVRNGGFDVVHIHEPLVPGPAYGCLLAGHQPKVGTFHRAGAGFGYRMLGVPARLLAGRLAARCAVSPEASSTARAVVGGSYEVVGNGVDVDRFENATPWPTSGPTVLFVGRHEPRKGLSFLLEAWDHLVPGSSRNEISVSSESLSSAPTLWVASEGPQTEALRRRFPSRPGLEWLGRISDDELASRLAGAHILCAPSTAGESFGMVLVEAMAARTAVVASDIPGYAYVAGTCGLLVRPGDVLALEAALRHALDDARQSSGLCSPQGLDAALGRARTWSMRALASRYVSIYERVISL